MESEEVSAMPRWFATATYAVLWATRAAIVAAAIAGVVEAYIGSWTAIPLFIVTLVLILGVTRPEQRLRLLRDDPRR
jgi:ribose/xylose/arabinose/galactoside ABC-type transport system permease subunit